MTVIHGEQSAAHAFVKAVGDRIRFDREQNCWFIFDGSRWRKDASGDRILAMIGKIIKKIAAKSDKRHAFERASFARGVAQWARSEQGIAVDADVWDRDPMLLGTPSGVIDLTTGVLRKATPEDMITRSTTVDPDFEAPCPIFDRFMNETVCGDLELLAFLRRFMGYALTGDVTEHALLFLHGRGGNGKGVLCRTIEAILGDYAWTTPMNMFALKVGDQISNNQADLRGRRFVVSSETEVGRFWDEQLIKSVTGGDTQTARRLRENNISFEPTAKIVVLSNHKPKLRDVGPSMRRRFNMALFQNTPVVDIALQSRLVPERPAIFAWAIKGCLEWKRGGGLKRPASIEEATNAYFEEENIVAEWLKNEVILVPNDHFSTVPSAALWASFVEFAKLRGRQPGRPNEWSEALQKAGAVGDRVSGGKRIYRGVALRAKAAE